MAANISIPKFNLRELASKIKQLGSAAFKNAGTQDNDLATVQYVNQGRKNLIRNGAMNVAQRGTSFSVSTVYTLDGWRLLDGGGSGSYIVAQVVDTNGKAWMNFARGSRSATFQRIAQRIELPEYFKGRTATLSFRMKLNTTQSAGDIRCGWVNGTAFIATYLSAGINTSLLGEEQYGKLTFTIPDDATDHSYFVVQFFGNSATGTTDYDFDITDVQLEEGSIATPFEYRPIAEELALCQRYYQELGLLSFNSNFFGSVGSSGFRSTSYIGSGRMRTTPTVTYSTTITGLVETLSTGATVATDTISVSYDNDAGYISVNGTTAGSNQAGRVRINTNATVYLDAEL